MNAAQIDTGAGTPTATPTAKDFATVQAQFAIRGHQLIRGSDLPEGQQDYMVNCWGWTRYFKTWPEVLEFLEQIGGRA